MKNIKTQIIVLRIIVMCVDIERMDVRMERMERRTLRQLQYSTCVVYKLMPCSESCKYYWVILLGQFSQK